MTFESILSFGAFLGVNFVAALSGAVFKPGEWYQRLKKPGWTPANWVFPVVWTFLYTMNAVAGWLVWETGGPGITFAIGVYGVSLLFNAAWSAVFFGLRQIAWGLVDVVLLWASLAATIWLFLPIDMLAGLLLLPYLVWVSTAALLNFQILQLNGARSA